MTEPMIRQVVFAVVAGAAVGALLAAVPMQQSAPETGADVHAELIAPDDGRDWPDWQVVQSEPRTHEVITSADDVAWLRLESVAGAENASPFQMVRDLLNVGVGATVRISLQARADQPAAVGTARVQVEDVAQVGRLWLDEPLALTGAWQDFQFTFTGPADDALPRLVLLVRGDTAYEFRRIRAQTLPLASGPSQDRAK